MDFKIDIRKIDSIGRFVIPVVIRNKLNIKENDKLEFFIAENSIILKKYEPSCIFCNSSKNLVYYHEKLICNNCIIKIKK